ncbi:Threonine dehydrogenase [Fontibacillus panacisegetis]|uniref:Threonine dehydrogenase n=1 Tax=Fontibacillus panacisegetis TaxID=670482 RepID=A0A1G7TKV9_9BACL|nr:alcohol dehydrogenase catalytic domain-containing protein [Fontibacillus panacisegetis]SDG35309.1 Threonine dehydrogenase [Fontibacillus panacisegetis]
MKALEWSEKNRLELCDRLEPQCVHEDDVKVRVELSGICGTDLAVITGKEPGISGVIRGHEAVGTVIQVSSKVTRFKAGDRVVIDPNQSCGKCRFCQKGQLHLCIGADGQGMRIAGLNTQGMFAPYVVSKEQFVHKLPDSISWEAAVLIEPLACVLHNFNEAEVTAIDRVLILGSGPMGLLCQIVSKHLGCVTMATECNPYRLSLARQFSDVAVLPDELDDIRVNQLLGVGKFDVVIDTVGNQMAVAEQWVERGGRIIPFGINGKYEYTIHPTHYTQNAVKLIGAGEYLGTFEESLQFAANHPELSALVTRKLDLEDYETAIHELLGYNLETGASLVSQSLKTVFVF